MIAARTPTLIVLAGALIVLAGALIVLAGALIVLAGAVAPRVRDIWMRG